MAAVAAELVDVRKTFGPTVALDHVSLRAFEGEVHAIIGGNGSGKSTLAKVISGVLQPDSGQVSIFGKSATTPAESKALGIANVYQEVLVADECSVLDNLFLGADGLFGAAEPHDVRHARARAIMSDLLGFDLDPDTIVGDLPLSIKQWITIARAMLTKAAMTENDPIGRLDRHALVMAIWMPAGLVAAVLLGHGIAEGGAWWITAGFAVILLGFAGHVIVNAVLGGGFTPGETALGMVSFAAALIAFLLAILVAPAALAASLVLPVGIGLASLVIAVLVYLVIRHGPRGAFELFDVIRDNNRRGASRLPHRGGRR